MKLFFSYDPEKRERTLNERGLDFAHAGELFARHHFTAEDLRKNYGERRFISVGKLDQRMVIVVWTPIGDYERRIISMRKANEREKTRYSYYLDGS
jgi:uncharacterized DUF497 family protein|nr:BrnT family toxin [Oxalobacteraceae bacterium]